MDYAHVILFYTFELRGNIQNYLNNPEVKCGHLKTFSTALHASRTIYLRNTEAHEGALARDGVGEPVRPLATSAEVSGSDDTFRTCGKRCPVLMLCFECE